MSAASDRIRELVYPTKPRIYVGLGDPPDERVTAEDLKAVLTERAELLAELEAMRPLKGEMAGLLKECLFHLLALHLTNKSNQAGPLAERVSVALKKAGALS